MNEQLIKGILKVFPKDKAKMTYPQIMNATSPIFRSNSEFEEALNELERKEYIKGFIQTGFSITDAGLEYLEDLKGKDYIIKILFDNNGIFNFLHLSGKKFKNEPEKFAIIQELREQGYIKRVEGALGQTHMLTDKFYKEQFRTYHDVAVRKIRNMPDQETFWESFVNELSVPDRYRNDLKTVLMAEGYIMITKRTQQGDLFRLGHQVGLQAFEHLFDRPTGSQKPSQPKPVENKPQTIKTGPPISKLETQPMNNKTEDKGYIKIKTELFVFLCGLVVPIIGAAYIFGKDRGEIKHDQTKIDLTEENRTLKAEKADYVDERIKDSVIIDSLVKKLDTLEKDYETSLRASGIIYQELENLKKDK